MRSMKFGKRSVTAFAALALLAAPPLAQLGCDGDGDAEEAIEELRDEAGDAADEIEDEFDDNF